MIVYHEISPCDKIIVVYEGSGDPDDYHEMIGVIVWKGRIEIRVGKTPDPDKFD